jgi:DNA-binding NarL/FixJ family response regulator
MAALLELCAHGCAVIMCAQASNGRRRAFARFVRVPAWRRACCNALKEDMGERRRVVLQITPWERDALQLLAVGMADEEIATVLHISEGTVNLPGLPLR